MEIDLSRPNLSEALDAWRKVLAERGHPTDIVWIFQENLCIERSSADKSDVHFGIQTKFSTVPEDALEIAYDQFCLTEAPIIFYRLGTCQGQSACMLLCDFWFQKQTNTSDYVRREDWGICFYPGQAGSVEVVNDLSRWVHRVRRGHHFPAFDFCMSLETIDEIMVYGRPLMPYERLTSRMVNRLRQILNPM